MGTEGSSQAVKRPVREADHPLPSTAEMKEWQSYTVVPQNVFTVCVQLRE
jgi:hypothetical protein